METISSAGNQTVRAFARRLMLPVLALALLASGAGIGAFASALAQTSATPVATTAATAADLCPDDMFGAGSEPWVRGELYFGAPQAASDTEADAKFDSFLDTEVTPRFPDGLTLLTGYGQWRNSAGEITHERSKVLIILYPSDTAQESSAKLEEIREAYKAQFNQESVLRADAAGVCTSF
jgi:hypothetical protein